MQLVPPPPDGEGTPAVGTSDDGAGDGVAAVGALDDGVGDGVAGVGTSGDGAGGLQVTPSHVSFFNILVVTICSSREHAA